MKQDDVGIWTEVKLDILKKYATAYSTILTKSGLHHSYIDAFAGSGEHTAKRTGRPIPGSPSIALSINPPFKEFHFIELDRGRAENLRRLTAGRSDVHIHEGDCNQILMEKVLPRFEWSTSRRGLCLLDPYALAVDWAVLERAGRLRTIEVFYNFMVMDANMNVLWKDRHAVSEENLSRMDRVWGDRSWENAAYKKVPGLFNEIEEREDASVLAEAFRKRLRDVAGFAYVSQPMPMYSKGHLIYYLFFASPNSAGGKIVAEIFSKYRGLGPRSRLK